LPNKILENGSATDVDRKGIHDFFSMIAMCHTVMTTENVDDPEVPKYQASSPDELALVEGAARMGFIFKEKKIDNQTYIPQNGDAETWNMLAEIPFNSDRKC
jgi:magnesium-transporting ATPase (P-type)